MSNKAVMNRRIAHHIANLNSPDEKVSYLAERYLIRYYGARALDQLVEVSNHPNPMVRLRVAWILGHTHDPRAFETILRLSDDANEEVRYDATIALGILGDERAIESLIQIYLTRHDPDYPPAHAFEKIGLKAVPALMRVLQQGNPDVRWSVTQLLGNFAEERGDERCIALLRESLKDPDPMVREIAEFWLKEIEQSAHAQRDSGASECAGDALA